jgi:hypothetical protein
MSRELTCYIRSGDGEWIQLDGCRLHVIIKRRLQRRVERGGEGDDLEDEGSESAVYTIRLNVDDEGYKKLESIFRAGQPHFIDPFLDREMKTAISEIEYDAATGEFKMVLIEDII